MKILLAFVLFVACSVATAGDWTLQTIKDAKTGRTSKQAFVTSPGGEKFNIMLRSDGSVWGYIQLAGGNQFIADERLTLRVDANKRAEFNEDYEKLTKKHGNPTEAWEWNPTMIGFLMWYGNIDEGCGLVKQLFNGKELIVRYHRNTFFTRDIKFPLTGNQKAISDAVGFDVSTCAGG